MYILRIEEMQIGKWMTFSEACYWQNRIAELMPQVVIKMIRVIA
jgi:hypothetical protein